mmetsp:Transcript_4601/g.8742  ORF Transcript_4601/g.8742 Transcript_4601/m.8742 type:complete len:232 (-) Transcript_4601:672-1367(-)
MRTIVDSTIVFLNEKEGADDHESLFSTGDEKMVEPLEIGPLESSSRLQQKDWKRKLLFWVKRYPRAVIMVITLVMATFLSYAAYVYSQPPLVRHGATHDYTLIRSDYQFDKVNINHYCLFGDDESCDCESFKEPIPRPAEQGWTEVHEANKARISDERISDDISPEDYFFDLVFYGDDIVENLNGKASGRPIPEAKAITTYFNENFTYKGKQSNINSIAMGITGDSVRLEK